MPDLATLPSLEYIKIELHGPMALVQLNNPTKANALNKKMWFELGGAATALKAAQDRVKVVILAGLGRHFCSGIHLDFLKEIFGEGRALAAADRPAFLKLKILAMQQAFHSFYDMPQPVIAVTHGVCVGAGLDLICAADIRIATFNTVFSVLETKLGIIADIGTLQRAPYLISEGKLRELTYTSDLFSGWSAKRWGLVNHLALSRYSALAKAFKLANKIAALPDYAVFGSKQILNENYRRSIMENLEKVAEYNSHTLCSEAAERFFAKML